VAATSAPLYTLYPHGAWLGARSNNMCRFKRVVFAVRAADGMSWRLVAGFNGALVEPARAVSKAQPTNVAGCKMPLHADRVSLRDDVSP
jgi:hypothetical protein